MTSSLVTVTSAATSRKFVDFSYARLMLGLTVSSYSDEKLDNLIDSVSAMVERWLNRPKQMFRETVSEKFRLDRAEESLMLQRWPVASVTSIVEDTVTLDADDWEINYDTGELWRLSDDERILWSDSPVTVVYTAGYMAADETSTDLPEDLQSAVMELISAARFSQGRNPYVRSEEIPGALTLSYGFGPGAQSDGISSEIAMKLAPYRKGSVG